MIVRIENMIEWHLEGVRNFDVIQQQLKAGAHEADHWRHTEAANDDVIRQIASDGNEPRVETDFFLRFA